MGSNDEESKHFVDDSEDDAHLESLLISQPLRQSTRSRACHVLTFVGVFALGLFVGGFLTTPMSDLIQCVDSSAQVNLKPKGPIPEMPLESTVFVNNRTYSAPASDDTDVAWNKLMPKGRGFVYVPDADSYGLPPGRKTKHGPIYSVAMFHQLHCLGVIRKAYWTFYDGVATDQLALAKLMTGRHASHAHHCLDYLRQSIMCAGDMTLEWPQLDGPAAGIAVDGWGVTHQCKSFDAIMAYMDAMHYNESMSIDITG